MWILILNLLLCYEDILFSWREGGHKYCMNFAQYSIMHTDLINFQYLTTIKLIQKTTSWLISSFEYTIFAYHVPYPYACLNFRWLVSPFFFSKIKTKLFIKSSWIFNLNKSQYSYCKLNNCNRRFWPEIRLLAAPGKYHMIICTTNNGCNYYCDV